MIDYVGLTYLELAASAVVFIIFMKISAPYGRFIRKGWGPGIKARWAWVIMEFPAKSIRKLNLLVIPDLVANALFTPSIRISLSLWQWQKTISIGPGIICHNI